jgi:hypothetical protein
VSAGFISLGVRTKERGSFDDNNNNNNNNNNAHAILKHTGEFLD